MRGQEEGDDEDIVGMTGLCTSLRSRKNWQSFHTTKTTRIRRPEMKDMITGIRILSTNTILVILLVLMIIHATCAQNDGVFGQTVCACTPRSYQFTFILNNETSSCLNNKIVGDGVITTECSIAPFQNTTTPITDLVPVAIDTIDILELDKDLVFIAQASKFGTYGNNDTFEYTSITSNLTSFNVSTTPKALQLSMLGKNTAGNDIFFQILIIFSTNCSTYPIIQPGTQLGWITLVS